MFKKYHYKNFSDRRNIRTGAIAIALMGLLLPACAENRPVATTPETPAATAPQTNVTTEEVAENTNQLIGQTVTIRSEPVRKITPSTFTVTDNEFFGGETILVVNASGKQAVLPEDTELQITGQVAKFVAADVEREYNLDLDPNLYVDYEGKPAIIAQSIAPAPKPGEISTNPSVYYNKVIAVPAEVEKIVGPNAFTLDEEKLLGGQDLLVLVQNQQKPVREGEKVVVTGVLREFVVADIERDYDFTWEAGLQRTLEAEYKNRPVLIAESVYPSALPESAQ